MVAISSMREFMMRFGSALRGLVVVCAAVAIGWWAKGAGTPVLAQRSGSSSSSARSGEGLEFQMSGAGPGAVLTLFNPGNRTLYVYQRIGEGNSHISCSYSFTVSSPGAPIDRENCPVGEQVR
jgi:hypothetical protein